MQADFRDDYVEAAAYYDQALALDPANVGLLTNAVVSRMAMGDVAGARPLADRLEAADPGNQVGGAGAARRHARRGRLRRRRRRCSMRPGTALNPLLGGLLAGWIEVGRDDFAAAKAKFDAMTGNDALTAYGQYHKALALALAGDFVSAETILAGGDKGPLHLNRSAIVAHAEILAQLDREADAVKLIDDALAGGVPDAPLLDLRRRLAAGEEVPFDQVTSAARRRGGGLPDARRRAQHRAIAAGGAGACPPRRAHPPRPDRGASCSPPRSSRPRGSTRSPPRRWPTCPRPRPGSSPPRSAAPTPSAPPAIPTPASRR